MPKTYYPSNDLNYDAWLANFVETLTQNAGMVGLIPADLTAITALSGEFTDKYSAGAVLQRSLAKGATSAKVNCRTESEAVLKPLVQRIQKHPAMTDQLRSLLGLVPQYVQEMPIPITELKPLLSLVTDAGKVTVHWGPNPANEHLNGKPAGVKGCNIYRKVVGDEGYQLMAYATTSPFTDYINGPATDYTYVVRYRGTKQTDISTESESATIAARGELAA